MKVNKVVAVGHILTTLPIILVFCIAYLISDNYLVNQTFYFFLTYFITFSISWMWWSYIIPHWRIWAYTQVNDIERLKKIAEKSCLIWKEGSLLSKTEFKIK